MINEEKAEESYIKYRDEKCEITRNTYNHLHKDWRKSGVDRHKAYIDGYLDGIVEGRKEYSETPCTSCCITESLESDLSELNYQFVNLEANAKALEKENAELKKENESLKNILQAIATYTQCYIE